VIIKVILKMHGATIKIKLIRGFLYMVNDCIRTGVLNKASEIIPNICILVHGTPDAIIF